MGEAMLRPQLTDALKQAMKSGDQRATSTLRLILAALKDRDIAARGKGNTDGISDQEIQQMFQTMVKQRREAIALYEQGGRLELAEQEREEIAIIERFMPKQLSEAELETAVRETVAATGAGGLKDMGRVMAALKERFAGQIDFTKASGVVRKQLGG